ncbi:MAG TPA: tetratricopeptide repeat protein [Methylococcaceae bacterium]|nr:tetratricopeptide repeat protein [Methylococcaceae bacterium]
MEAYTEARRRFTGLGEPGMVAVSWHQTGRAHQEAGDYEAAEDAYRQALAIEVRLGDVAGQASTLGQLGILYADALGRTEEAVAFLRQSAEKSIEIGDQAGEGRRRSNLADSLRKLRRLDEARQEIRRAIRCKSGFSHASAPWKSWAILAGIETDAGDLKAAAEAGNQARQAYLAYRRAGGENHDPAGRIAFNVTQLLLAGQAAEAASLLQELATDPGFAWLTWFIQALQAIVAGSRDRRLADAPDLHYTMAAEILILLETLEKAGQSS